MKHASIDELLLPYVLEQLSSEERMRVEQAAARDPVVAQALRETARVVEWLPDPAAETEPRPGFDARLQARLESVGSERRAPRWAGWSLASAALAGAVALGLWGRPFGDFVEQPAPVPRAMLAELELLRDLDAIQLVDVVEDLDAIESWDETDGT